MIRKIVLTLLIVFVSALIITYSGIRIWIGSDLDEIIEKATELYEGDTIEALISYLESDDHSLVEKNNAIWALGKLADERALPALNDLVVGDECSHSEYVCQRTLSTSINTIKGEQIDIMTYRYKIK